MLPNKCVAASKPIPVKVTTIKGGLTNQHKLVIDDLFERGLSEAEVCEKHGLAMDKLREWSRDDAFRREVSRRLFTPVTKAWVMLARSAPIVAARLIELTKCEKEETARKACLDIFAMLPRECNAQNSGASETPLPPLPFSEKTASRLLDVLAEEEGQSVSSDIMPTISENEPEEE
jgi:hypothetical protein